MVIEIFYTLETGKVIVTSPKVAIMHFLVTQIVMQLL